MSKKFLGFGGHKNDHMSATLVVSVIALIFTLMVAMISITAKSRTDELEKRVSNIERYLQK